MAKLWNSELKRAKNNKSEPSLLRVLVKCFGPYAMFLGCVLAVVEFGLQMSQPIFLGGLIRYFAKDSNIPYGTAIRYAVCIIACSALNVFIRHPYSMGIFHTGMKIRVGMCSLIYRKATWFGKMTSTIRLRTAKRTDQRIRFMNEIIVGIQVIKMYAWEKPFAHLVSLARKREIRAMFVVAAYFNIIKYTTVEFLPMAITQLAEASVSVKRIKSFLLYDEVKAFPSLNADIGKIPIKDSIDNIPYIDAISNEKINDIIKEKPASDYFKSKKSMDFSGGIRVNNVTAKWSEDLNENTLTNVSLDIKPGGLVAVIGPVGAGKSSLLQAILRELPFSSGSIFVGGTISYASQEPWLFAGSVRKNILFGQPMIRERYKEVIRVCALERDLQLLPHGDKTIVGERGVTLSGGQRARINLARAIYKEADLYLLDDPLSAVDTHVGRHLFDDCICDFLEDKSRILVTHQLQYLQSADKIVILNNIGGDDREPEMVAEMRTRGKVSSYVYKAYCSAGGNCCITMIVFGVCILAQVAISSGDYWMSFWSNVEQSRPRPSHIDTDNTTFEDFNSSSLDTESTTYSALGQILNRFSKDMGSVDESLPMTMFDCTIIGLQLMGVVLVVAIVNFWLLIPTGVMFAFFYLLRVYYVATSRSVKRLEGIRMLQWGMRQSAELENNMTSLERILEYTNVESEPPLDSLPGKKPDASWPSKGEIVFSGAVLAYSKNDPPVLKNVNFSIKGSEKVGIVGRTGAGKSSLITALFRLCDLSDGSIFIDGINAASIGLHDLRSKISIIPQEPALFSGLLRENLDPFSQYSDGVLWAALEEVELKQAVEELPAGLSHKVSEGGSNFSVGQRQLLCLARAIIRDNKILVMDEATANVDPQTDELIQATIRRKFANCTVLTIAHRLHTVMDSDRILVMDAGQVVEFDHPHLLLKNENGIFYQMVEQTGHAMAESLFKVAKTGYEKSSKES
ncbi:hypothetical protein C0J52_02253 [Blattella germanica]|nr:hypothetical protein C0J52_02253 [Blattella germanica]